MEDGEDIQELSERNRERKDKRAANKLVREAESRGSPALEVETPRGGRKTTKKGKAKADPVFDATPLSGKRKRGGMKSMSVTPSINNDEDDEERDFVSFVIASRLTRCSTFPTETSQDESC